MTKKYCRCDFQVEALPLVLRLVSLWKEEEGDWAVGREMRKLGASHSFTSL